MFWPANAASAECRRYVATVIQFNCTTTTLALNEDLDVVGRFACAGGNNRAFVAYYRQAQMALNLGSQIDSKAEDINTGRQIVGTATFVGLGGFQGFSYLNGVTTPLGWLVGHTNSQAEGVSDAGIIVGMTANTQVGPQLACRWIDGVVEPLNLPIGPSGFANAIDPAGRIVGWMGDAPNGSFFAEAFLWDNGTVTPLGIPDGAVNSEANAISDSGQICGTYTWTDKKGDFIRRAVVWRDGRMIPLGTTPGYQRTYGHGINDSGEVVGYSDNANLAPSVPGGGAFIWRDGVMRRLFSLLAPGSGLTRVSYAYDITNSGHIASSGSQGQGNRSVLLSPLPPKAGDINCDWVTNVDDLLGVINTWGPDAPPEEPFSGTPDLDRDGAVNVDDLLAVINGWGG